MVALSGGQEPFHALGQDVGGEGAVEEGYECVGTVGEYHPILWWSLGCELTLGAGAIHVVFERMGAGVV